MSRTKLLTLLIIGLMLLNITLMIFLVLGKPAPPPRPGQRQQPKEIIIQKLGFDQAQIDQYDKLIEQHRRQIHQKQGEINRTRRALYESLQAGKNINQDSLIARIGELQSEVEQIHLAHFKALHQICTPEQQSRFDELTHELARLFGPPPPHRR